MKKKKKIRSNEEIDKIRQALVESDEAIKILNDEKELDRRVKKSLNVLQPISEEKAEGIFLSIVEFVRKRLRN